MIPASGVNAYDAEGHAVTFENVGVTYDALGRVVESAAAGRTVEFLFGPGGSERLGVMSGQRPLWIDIALPGGGDAVYVNGPLDHYLHADWLGSGRLASTPGGGLQDDDAFAPHGGSLLSTDGVDASFTGQGMGIANNQYDFPMREYSPIQGRWWTPDPAGLAAVNPANPQSWNRYAYALNDPLTYTDPTGLFAVVPAGCVGTPNADPETGDYYMCGDTGLPGFRQAWDADPSDGGGGGGSGQAVQTAKPPPPTPTPSSAAVQPPGQLGAAQTLACTQAILADVNRQFGTSLSQANVQGQPFLNGGAQNLTVLATGLPAGEFNALITGRYPMSLWTWITGIGPTLHITGATWLDPPPAEYQNSNVGGVTSVLFTAHVDSGFAYNPLGAIFHLITDVLHLGGPRGQCQ